MTRNENGQPITVAMIQAITAHCFDVPVQSMTSKRRFQKWAYPRMAAMVIARVMLPKVSYPALGRMFNRDHTTILYGERRAMRLAKKRPEFKDKLDAAFAGVMEFAPPPPPELKPAPEPKPKPIQAFHNLAKLAAPWRCKKCRGTHPANVLKCPVEAAS